MAVGARSADVLRLMFRHTMALAAAGLLIGALLSLAATRLIQHWLYEMSPLEPRAFLVAAIVLLSSVAAAAWLPARRATRVDPLVALRQD
jgi:ABC-type antimicrobial peptide transport system permease subunit